MAITGKTNFIVYTNDFIFMENIKFDLKAWATSILSELSAFYFDNIGDKIFVD